jgi:hypothetical protein
MVTNWQTRQKSLCRWKFRTIGWRVNLEI